MSAPTRLHLAQDDAADRLLASDPFALLTGMLLDQQFPMERAFGGPYLITPADGHGPARPGRPSRPSTPRPS